MRPGGGYRGAMMPEARSDEGALRSKFMLIFRGGAVARHDLSPSELVEDLFRREYAPLVSALTRVLGPSNIPLAEDVVHDALVSAMHAWRFGLPQDLKAWIIRAAHNRAIDIIRREQRRRSFLPELATTTALTDTIEAAF